MNSNHTYHPQGVPITTRLYQTILDLEQMQALLMEARSRTDDWHYWHIGDLMWEFFLVTCHLTPQEHIRLWHDGNDELVGFAMLGDDPSIDCQVLPEYAGNGIEAEALAWVETLLTELRSHDPRRWRGNLVTCVRQDDAGRITFLEQHGFRRAEHIEVNLLRSLDEIIPEPQVPDGFRIRSLDIPGEIPQRAAAERAVWLPYTDGDVSGNDYARLVQYPSYDRDLDIVAVSPEGVIASYVNGWIDPLNRIGDFGPVGALPAYRRQGLTQAVLQEGLRRMKTRGMDRVCVSTGSTNLPALRLYESVGFKIVNEYLEYLKIQ
jgi:mycothiol synthase